MDLVIGGKEYTLEFGLKFINEMDNLYTVKRGGLEFGMGIEMAVSYIAMRNVTVIYNIIKAGTAHLKSKPSNQDIEAFLSEHAKNKTLEQLFSDIEEAMEKAPFLEHKINLYKQKALIETEEE